MLHLDALSTDVRHIIRGLARRPAFSVAAILTMAIGMGAVTAVVAVIEAVLLRPLPYPRPDRLYSLSATVPQPAGQPSSYLLSAVEYIRTREGASTLEQVEAMSLTERALSTGGEPETVQVGVASAGYLHLFGLDPVIGRGFTESEDRERAAVAILDGGVWQRSFGSDPSVIGRTVLLDGAPHVVIGVTPAGYQPQLQLIDAWLPLGAVVDPVRPGTRLLLAAARLRAGPTVQQAQEELNAIQAGIARDFPQTHSQARLVFADMHDTLYGPFRPALLLLLGGVMFLLLIANTSVANLAMGRVVERRGEIALRLSLGAEKSRILGYQLTESALVTAIGCLFGAILAMWALPAIIAVYPAALPNDIRIAIQPLTIALVFALMAISTMIAGFVPAWRASSTTAATVLAQASVRTAGHARDRRAREWLLACQIAIAVLLLGTAGMVATSFARLNRTDPGFDSESVLTMQLAPPARYPQPQARAAFVGRVLDRIKEVPGVLEAGTTQTTWQVLASMQTRIEIEGRPLTPEDSIIVHIRHVTPGYFAALRVNVTDGRAIDDRDAFGGEPVAMVSQSFADGFWAGQPPIGRRFRRTTAGSPWLTVVGVARDVMDSGLGWNLGPTIYLPYMQQNTATARVTLVVRSTGDPARLATAIQKAIWAVDVHQPIDAVRTLDAAMSASTAQPRFRATVLSILAVVGLVLACVGVYGVASYGVRLRRREIGIRIALGARREEVVAMLVRQSLWPVTLGIVAGGIGAIAFSGRLNALLNQPESADAGTTAAAASILFLCSLVATWLPARRNARTAPIDAIREY